MQGRLRSLLLLLRKIPQVLEIMMELTDVVYFRFAAVNVVYLTNGGPCPTPS
jgi:hypothetical protein